MKSEASFAGDRRFVLDVAGILGRPRVFSDAPSFVSEGSSMFNGKLAVPVGVGRPRALSGTPSVRSDHSTLAGDKNVVGGVKFGDGVGSVKESLRSDKVLGKVLPDGVDGRDEEGLVN